LSPILFNLSFSVNGTAHTDDKEVKPGTADTILNFFLESIGATITEFKDVKFRFKPFNINNLTITWKELYDELFDHYKIQTLHQAYVLILGLDVLGNPFGLVSDFSQGLQDLFYDPLLGYFTQKGNSEPIQFNISNKVRSTVNQTISSVAGSGSLISGSIGRVLATVTFDSEYKKVNSNDKKSIKE
jgi:vacuolar protein sorting-associated protein 13A/C